MVTTPNQGPATEPFTPPKSCLSTTTYTTSYSGIPAGFTLGTDLDCFPPPTSALVSPTTSFVKLYSPGICPVGYTYATPYTKSISGQRYDDSVTRYICCPDTYTAAYLEFYGNEICEVTTDFVPYATATGSGLPRFTAVATFAFGEPTTSVIASPIIVAWQETDAKVLEALTERGVSPDWPPATAQERMTILLSVLLPVGVILLALAGWLYWLHRKGRLHRGQIPLCCLPPPKNGEQHHSDKSRGLRFEKPELSAESRPRNSDPEDQSSLQPGACELHAEPTPIREADSRGVIPELNSKLEPLPFQGHVLHPNSASAEKAAQRPSTR